jgi:hypothetical protein
MHTCGALNGSSFCTPQHEKFIEQSKKKWSVARAALDCRERGEDPYPKTNLRFSAPTFPGLGGARTVAFLQPTVPVSEAGLTAMARRLTVKVGWDRCRGADLVVVDTIAPLIGGQAADHTQAMTAADALLIIGLGKTVVPYGSWMRAKCDPGELTAVDAICHESMIKTPAKLVFSPALRNIERDAYRAAMACCAAGGSKWEFRKALTAGECQKKTGEELFNSAEDVWEFVRRLRRVKNYMGQAVPRHTSGVSV